MDEIIRFTLTEPDNPVINRRPFTARLSARCLRDSAYQQSVRGRILCDCAEDGATAQAGRQWLGRYGKTDNGVVAVTTRWAGRVHYRCTPRPAPRQSSSPKGRTTGRSGQS
jgi:hypothetical protein